MAFCKGEACVEKTRFGIRTTLTCSSDQCPIKRQENPFPITTNETYGEVAKQVNEIRVGMRPLTTGEVIASIDSFLPDIEEGHGQGLIQNCKDRRDSNFLKMERVH